ncbi:MAG: SusC/RagA family TonB-linked outer membrane protein [Bacteroidales bacterium]|nr:SusC/RagA family TonB-linked outer membrane protein [Bacteroidales bacterium]
MKKIQFPLPGNKCFYLTKLLLFMKLTTFLLFINLVSFAATGYSQAEKVTIQLKNGSLKDLFSTVEQQTSYKFLYRDDAVENILVNLDEVAEPLDNILNQILDGSKFTYKILANYLIVIAPRELLQQQKITGTVTDETGSPLPGVNIQVEGTTFGAISDASGEYSIDIPNDNAVLIFSFIGYTTQKVSATGRTIIDITLVPSLASLEEVVVIGYGSVRKSDLTGTVSSVSTDKTRDIPNTNVLQSLQGSVAGLNVVTPDQPGENPAIDIRGINSLSAGNTPLIVVDGIIYNGSLNDFSVSDIKKIDILKDASAAAVYGSRSSNGVIILTTKMGTTSKPLFNFNSYYGISVPTYLVPVMDGPGYIQKILDFRSSVGMEADPAKIEDYLGITEVENYRNGKSIDWYDHIVKPGATQNYDLNVSGQTDKTNYYLSVTHYNQKGIVENDNFKRTTVKANFTNKITDWYSISLRTAFSSMDYSGVRAGLNYGLSPYGVYWEDEARGIYKELPMDDIYPHPMMNTFIDNKDIRTSVLGIASSELNIPFIEGLKWTMNYSNNLRNQKVNNFWDNTLQAGNGKTLNGSAQKGSYDNYDWTLDNIINYNREFLDVHSVDVTLLYSREYQKYESTYAEGNDFFNQALGYNNLNMAKVQRIESDYQDQNSVAYMARLNYIYNNKYSLTATIRKDGFSGFANNNKYATFPSVAFAWTASNENFMKNIKWITMLKTRISYGANGNQSLGRYQTLARIANSQYVFGDGGSTATTTYLVSMANSDLGWETTKVINLGVDLGLINNRLDGSIDIYSSNTYNILLNRNIPAASGYSSVWTNIGKVHNQGVEIALNSRNIQKKDFEWETGFVFSLNRNRIDELLGEDMDGDGKEDDNLVNSWFIGKPLGVIYGYKTNGIYQLDDTDIPSGFVPGDFRLVDTDNDGELTPKDRTILGSRLPNYTFSIANTLRYKSFSLYLLISSIQGGGKDNYYVGNNIAMHDVNNAMSTWTERLNIQDVPYWTPENPSNEFSRINYMPNRSHPYLEDRSFVKLQDVNLAYIFDKATLEKIHLQGLRFYVSGKNIFTWTKWTGYDPENSTTIGDFPMLRTFTFGVDLKF